MMLPCVGGLTLLIKNGTDSAAQESAAVFNTMDVRRLLLEQGIARSTSRQASTSDFRKSWSSLLAPTQPTLVSPSELLKSVEEELGG